MPLSTRQSLKTLHNIPDWASQRANRKENPPQRKQQVPPKQTTQPARIQQQGTTKASEDTNKPSRVRRIYSREFLLKFKYVCTDFPPGVTTPEEIIAQYNKDFELRERQAVQGSTSSLSVAGSSEGKKNEGRQEDALGDTKQGVVASRSAQEGDSSKNLQQQQRYKLRLSSREDDLFRKPMFLSPAKRVSAPPPPSLSLQPPSLDKENLAVQPPTQSKKPSTKTNKQKPSAPSSSIPLPSIAENNVEKKEIDEADAQKHEEAMENGVETQPVEKHEEVIKDEASKENSVVDSMDSLGKKTKTSLKETDPHRLSQRQKQIDFGKNTVGYQTYIQLVPKNQRKRGDPKTPNKYQVCSKRSWDGQVRKWRRMLHKYDPPGTTPSNPETNTTPTAADLDEEDSTDTDDNDNTPNQDDDKKDGQEMNTVVQ
jgi:hypothetical protein